MMEMDPLRATVLGFVALELSNVAALYFWPGSKRFNALGVFRAWQGRAADSPEGRLAAYLAEWVAGVKLIFIALLLVLVWRGEDALLRWAVVGLIVTMASFYWRLFPRIRDMDARGELEPEGYAGVLGWMVGVFMLALSVAVGHAFATA